MSHRQSAPLFMCMETIKGYIDHIIYRNADNGYTVMELVSDGEEITCVGSLPDLDEGENVEFEGEYSEHALYGQQFSVTSYRVLTPEDASSMERYLASGIIRGIGATLASRIVKKFGDDTFRIIEEEPERLAEIKGISERIAREIAMQFEEKKGMRDALIYLQKYGISNTLAIRIYKNYGAALYGVMNENPYRLAEEVDGIGFKIADEIARKIGFHSDSDHRIRSGILYTLYKSVNDGNCYLPVDLLLEKSGELLELDPEMMRVQIANLMMDKKIVVKKKAGGDIAYSMPCYYAELNCARMLKELNISVGGEEMLPSEERAIREGILRLEENMEIELDELQRDAVMTSIRNGITILSGGPGTGKTTTIRTMIAYFEREGMDLLLAAPTGRAAKRMTEATGYEAKTIHRLLELNGMNTDDGGRASFGRNDENPLETDVLIIDEMSMVDINLFQALLRAVPIGTRLVLVGDMNQLPSVGPGQVLKDLIASGAFPVIILKRIFRQAGESDIVVNAHLINKGEPIRMDNKSKDFFFLERNDRNVIYKHMIQLITEKLPGYVHAEPLEIQVLTPMRKGVLGVETLNSVLQKYLNPESERKEEVVSGERTFREGDKVMQIKNNYQLEWEIVSRYNIPIDRGLGVFNGDMGRILEIDPYGKTVTVEYDEGRRVHYPYTQLDEIELAYAITIHKSQGSEYPAVLMPLLSGPRMLMNRNLLYTGVTRAKECVVILGSAETVNDMIRNENEQLRFSSLSDRIRETEDL